MTPAFAIPDLYGMLEAESYFYAIRLRTNRVLQGKIAHLLKRPVGRPPNHVRRTYGDFQYQAASWDKPRRVIAKVEGVVARIGCQVLTQAFATTTDMLNAA